MSYWIVQIILLSFGCHAAHGFKCFQCNSYEDPTCLKNPRPETLLECVFSSESDEEIITLNLPELNCSNYNASSREEIEACKNETTFNTTSRPVNVDQPEFTMCRKIVTQVYGSFVYDKGDTVIKREHTTPRVTRGCGYEPSRPSEPHHENACIPRRNGGSHQLTCSCSREECNGAERMGLTTLLSPLSLIALAPNILLKH